jgi:hypothetical protein
MRSSEKRALAMLAVIVAATTGAGRARAQQPADGFGTERLSPSAAGGGWFVMDALDFGPQLAGAAGMTLSYAHDPLRIPASGGATRLAVVSTQAFADFGFAASYDRFRVSANFAMPLVNKGDADPLGGSGYASPNVDVGSHPDTLADTRFGLDVRVLGDPTSAFRLGLSAQLFVPSAKREDYLSDGTYRGTLRVLFAGDVGDFTYAGHLGLHSRPLDDSATPGSPRGSELLFGAAAGARLPLGDVGRHAFVVGPELYGKSAARSLFGSTTTGLEALLSARLEGTGKGAQVRVKLGAGAGLHPEFGAPQWRLVASVEMFDRGL